MRAVLLAVLTGGLLVGVWGAAACSPKPPAGAPTPSSSASAPQLPWNDPAQDNRSQMERQIDVNRR